MKKRKNRSIEIGILSVREAIEMLQALPNRYSDWLIYCCGSDEAYLNINEDEGYIVFDEEELFWEDADIDLAELYS